MSFAEAHGMASSMEDSSSNGASQVERAEASYAPKYQRFVVKSRSYTQQYSHIYNKRLTQMRELVRAAAKNKWTDAGKWRECGKVIDLRPDENPSGRAPAEWVVVGCIYKDQPLKPSILDEYGGDRGLEVLGSRANYSSSDDAIVLEDESGRVALCAGTVWSSPSSSSSSSSSSSAQALDLDGDGANPHGSKRRKLQHPDGDGNDDGAGEEDDIEDVALPSSAAAAAVVSKQKKRAPAFPLQRLVSALVTGVVMAVRGTVTETGEFAVSDICVPGLLRLPPAASSSSSSSANSVVPRPFPPADPSSSPQFVLLLSGLGFGALSNSKLAGSVPQDYELCLHLLSDFISGMTTSNASASGRIARVVVAGNLLAPPLHSTSAASRTAAASATYVRTAATSSASSSSSGAGAGAGGGGASSGPGATFSDRSLSIADQELLSAPMREADAWLATIASTVTVDVMPGENDPANFTMPQQKMHPCLFPATARFGETFKPVTNPYEGDVGGVKLLGSSGQPVLDIARYASSSTVIVPGDESSVGKPSPSSSSSAGSNIVISKSAGGNGSASSSGSSSSMDIDGGDAAEENGEGSSSSRHQAASGAAGVAGGVGFDEDGGDAEALPEASVVAAVSTTAGDRAMAMLAGTGAGAGHDARIAAAVQAAAEEASGDTSGTFEKRLAHEPLSVMRHVDILVNTLFWRHMAPTCPDTLSAYPFAEIDPFVLDPTRLPHIFFSGGAPSFDTRLVSDKRDPASTQVRVISVPDFIRTKTAVLVDISKPDLPVQPVRFSAM